MRTPLVIRWPDHAMNGQVITDAVSIDDIYPTLLASIGVAPEASLDGVSFYDNVHHHTSIRQRPRYWDHFNGMSSSYSVLDHRWALALESISRTSARQGAHAVRLRARSARYASRVATPAPQLEQMLADTARGAPACIPWQRNMPRKPMAVRTHGHGFSAHARLRLLYLRYLLASIRTGCSRPRPGYGSCAGTAIRWTATFGKVVLSGEIQRQSQCPQGSPELPSSFKRIHPHGPDQPRHVHRWQAGYPACRWLSPGGPHG